MIIDSLAADSIYQTPVAFYYLFTERGKSMTNSFVHKEETAALQRAPLVPSAESLFVASLAFVPHLTSNQRVFTSAKLCIWCPNASIIRHSRVPVYMPVKHFVFPVESSLGTPAAPTLTALLRREMWSRVGHWKMYLSFQAKKQHLVFMPKHLQSPTNPEKNVCSPHKFRIYVTSSPHIHF